MLQPNTLTVNQKQKEPSQNQNISAAGGV